MQPARSIGESLEAYLDTRYTCTALWAKTRRECPEKAKALRQGLEELCTEIRTLMRQQGIETVGEKFSPQLLSKPLDKLIEQCLANAQSLATRGSKAAKKLAEAAKTLTDCRGQSPQPRNSATSRKPPGRGR